MFIETRSPYASALRKPPDNGRRGQFKRGWRDATIRGQHYGDDTLAALTWCNLGYRFGRELRVSATEEIDLVWDHVSAIYQTERQGS